MKKILTEDIIVDEIIKFMLNKEPKGNWKKDLLKYDYIEKMCDDFNNVLEEDIGD